MVLGFELVEKLVEDFELARVLNKLLTTGVRRRVGTVEQERVAATLAKLHDER